MARLIMNKLIFIVTFSICAFYSPISKSVVQENSCDQDCKRSIVENYLEHIVEIFVLGSSVKEIDDFLSQVHEEIKYEHKEYGADFDKEKWRKAFIRQLERGSYKESKQMKGGILNIIYGKNHAAVEYSYGTLNSNGVWKKGHIKFALFGFKDKKVSLVREYW